MPSVSVEQLPYQQQNQLFPGKKDRSSPVGLQNLDLVSSPIPPRRLLDRKAKLPLFLNDASDSGSDAGKSIALAGEVPDSLSVALQKFLPSNKEEESNWPAVDAYSCDEFRIYEFKVRRCMRGRSHDWTDCPFAHPGEKARRRDPRRFHYSGTVCPDFKKGSCRRGDACEFAHGVFECWLHPARYRTQPCKDGRNCKRKICFFAHTSQQLRVLPNHSALQQIAPTRVASNPFSSLRYPASTAVPFSPSSETSDSTNLNRCCSLCSSPRSNLRFICKSPQVSSPTSTLIGLSRMSPPLSPSISPPMSPVSVSDSSVCNNLRGFSHLSCYQTTVDPSPNLLPGVVSYQNMLTELVNSLEAIDLASSNNNLRWGSFDSDQQSMLGCSSVPCSPASSVLWNLDEEETERQPQRDSGYNSFFSEQIISSANNNSNICCGPDLEWVNELVM